MRIRTLSLALFLGMLLMPLLALAKPGQDCINHPGNPNCAGTFSVIEPSPWSGGTFQTNEKTIKSVPKQAPVPMPEHWGAEESLGFCALMLIVFWAMIHFKVLRLASRT
jgi:hypothetical protein